MPRRTVKSHRLRTLELAQQPRWLRALGVAVVLGGRRARGCRFVCVVGIKQFSPRERWPSVRTFQPCSRDSLGQRRGTSARKAAPGGPRKAQTARGPRAALVGAEPRRGLDRGLGLGLRRRLRGPQGARSVPPAADSPRSARALTRASLAPCGPRLCLELGRVTPRGAEGRAARAGSRPGRNDLRRLQSPALPLRGRLRSFPLRSS